MPGILSFIHHPGLLPVAACLGLPGLIPLAKFFFESFDALRRDIGANDGRDRFGWLVGAAWWQPDLAAATVAFLGCYALLVVALYQGLIWIAPIFR